MGSEGEEGSERNRERNRERGRRDSRAVKSTCAYVVVRKGA